NHRRDGAGSGHRSRKRAAQPGQGGAHRRQEAEGMSAVAPLPPHPAASLPPSPRGGEEDAVTAASFFSPPGRSARQGDEGASRPLRGITPLRCADRLSPRGGG